MNILISTDSYFDFIFCYFIKNIVGNNVDKCYVYKNSLSDTQKKRLQRDICDYSIEYLDSYDTNIEDQIDIILIKDISLKHAEYIFKIACNYNANVKYLCETAPDMGFIERFTDKINVEIITLYPNMMSNYIKKYVDKVVILIGSVFNTGHQEYVELFLKNKFESYGLKTYIIWSNLKFSTDTPNLFSLKLEKTVSNSSSFVDILKLDDFKAFEEADIIIISLHDGVFELHQQPNCYYPSFINKVSPDYTVLVCDQNNIDESIMKNVFETIYKTKVNYCLYSDVSICKSPRLSPQNADYYINDEIDIFRNCTLLFNHMVDTLTIPNNCKKIN